MNYVKKSLIFIPTLIITLLILPHYNSKAAVIQPCSIEYTVENYNMITPLCGGGGGTIDPYKITIGSIGTTKMFSHYIRSTTKEGTYNFTPPRSGYYKIYYTPDNSSDYLSVELYSGQYSSSNVIAKGNTHDYYNLNYSTNYVTNQIGDIVREDFYLSAGVTYKIRVSNPYPTYSIINFSLFVKNDDDNVVRIPKSISSSNDLVNSRIDYTTDADYYTIIGKDQYIKIELPSTINASLYDYNDVNILDKDAKLIKGLEYGKTYTLKITGKNNYTGNYQFSITNDFSDSVTTSYHATYTMFGNKFDEYYFRDYDQAKLFIYETLNDSNLDRIYNVGGFTLSMAALANCYVCAGVGTLVVTDSFINFVEKELTENKINSLEGNMIRIIIRNVSPFLIDDTHFTILAWDGKTFYYDMFDDDFNLGTHNYV